jgi:hypothetical protein
MRHPATATCSFSSDQFNPLTQICLRNAELLLFRKGRAIL